MSYELKFKIGDEVEVLDMRGIECEDEEQYAYNTPDSDNIAEIGHRFKITKCDDDDASYKLDTDHDTWFAEEWLKPAKPRLTVQEMPKNNDRFSVEGARYWRCSQGRCTGAEAYGMGQNHPNHPYEIVVGATGFVNRRELQVGDTVKVKPPGELSNHQDRNRSGGIYEILDVQKDTPYYGDGGYTIRLKNVPNWDGGYPIGSEDVYIVDSSTPPPASPYLGTEAGVGTMRAQAEIKMFMDEATNKETPKMSSATNLVTSKLSAEERYARANYLKNADGTVTTDGQRVLVQYLWDANEKALIKALKEADKAILAAQKADETDAVVSPS